MLIRCIIFMVRVRVRVRIRVMVMVWVRVRTNPMFNLPRFLISNFVSK